MISVIVPVYNVESYIERCLNSIVSQTFTDLEILLINDGSTDDSLKICESYQKRDGRIKIFSQKNRGLSAARNLGLDKMSGEYVMFVDSDDWIHPKTIEILFNNLQRSRASMVIGGTYDTKSVNVEYENVASDFKVYNTHDALLYVYTKTGCSACGRLYKSSLFDTVRFPVGKTSEDSAVAVNLVEQCVWVAVNSSKFYYYYSRPNSICTSSLNIRKFDSFYVWRDLLIYVKQTHPFLINVMKEKLVQTIIALCTSVLMNKEERKYLPYVEEMIKYTRNHYYTLCFNPRLGWKYKILLTILFIDLSLYNFLFIKIKK